MNDNDQTRRAALATAGAPGIQGAVTRLTKSMTGSGAEWERAVRGLSEIARPAVGPLVEVLRAPFMQEGSRVKLRLVRFLCGPYGSWEYKIREGQLRAKRGAVRALGQIGDVNTIREIAYCCFDVSQEMGWDAEWGIRLGNRASSFEAEAVDAVVSMGAPAAQWIIDDSARLGWMLPQYKQFLVTFGKKGTLDATVDALRNPTLSREAAFILGETADVRAVRALAALLKSPDDRSRYDVAFALQRLRGEEAESALRDFETWNAQEIAASRLDLGALSRTLEKGPSIPEHEEDLCRFLLERYGTAEMARGFCSQSSRYMQHVGRQWLKDHGEK